MNWDGSKREISNRFRPGIPILSRGAKTWNLDVGGALSAFGLLVGAGGGIKIQFSEEKGAVVMPPKGADRTDCQNLAVFREYAKMNSPSWYEFINGTLGREVDNGAIYFITGFDKTNRWENAVIQDQSRERGCELIFTTSGLAGDGHLRLSSSSMSMSISSRCSPDGNPHQNQSLFIRGFRIAMRRKVIFNSSAVEVKSTQNLSPEDLFGRKGGGGSPFSRSSSTSSGSASAMETISSSSSSPTFRSSQRGSSPASDTSYDTISSEGTEEPGFQLYHPLNYINQYILESNHEVEVVITHDNDWISLLKDEDIEMPIGSTLVNRLHELLLHTKVVDRCAYLDLSRTVQEKAGTGEECTDEIPTKHQRNELPHAPASTNDRAGCWTCRIRRKRCDMERLEDNSCRTCKRLVIECLGWGAKQPDWMRNKQAVDDYKASIKAQLNRKGLSHGPPRPSTKPTAQASTGTTRAPGRSPRADSMLTSRSSYPRSFSPYRNTPDHSWNPSSSYPYPGSPPTPHFDHLTTFRLDLETTGIRSPELGIARRSGEGLSLGGGDYNTPDYSRNPSSSYSSYPYPVSPPTPHVDHTTFRLDLETTGIRSPELGVARRSEEGLSLSGGDLQTTPNIPVLSSQNSIQESHVMNYFDNFRRVPCVMSNHPILNTTFEFIAQDPRSALTNAVCALTNFHDTRSRVAQGLEAPYPNPEHSEAEYFYYEAFSQLVNIRGSYTETDVFAALHLVCYSQLSGGSTDWQPVLGIAFKWIERLGLLNKGNSEMLGMMSSAGQLSVKCIMMIDIISSVTLLRPPKYFNLYQRLLLMDNSNSLQPGGMQMEALSGCPDEAWLAIAEVSMLTSWKELEERKGSLSLRELVIRGDDIERWLRVHIGTTTTSWNTDPLPPKHMYRANVETTLLTDEVREVIANIFRETALLYLHTVVQGPSFTGREVRSSVDNIFRMMRQLEPSEADRTLIFPICLAGCMSDDSTHRDFFKGRLRAHDETIGNFMKVRLLMEGVWQRRDVGELVDWREEMRDRSFNLLLI
ncbi:hypothetical protein E1B28_010915 [Marasmius oreades]|nr:uncharacterized protein E1B28_010915 [Marasmius oreades]KAG7089213.1 hypothetical protein E1B28_010915 [Marasmius oreades]